MVGMMMICHEAMRSASSMAGESAIVTECFRSLSREHGRTMTTRKHTYEMPKPVLSWDGSAMYFER